MDNGASEDRCNEFVQLLAAHERRLANCVLALVPNWNEADDIIQETKLRLWEQFKTYDRTKDFGTWACVIARYEVQTFHTRSARSRIRFSQELVDQLSEELPEMDAESDGRVVFLEECVKKLTEWQRNLLWRWYAVDRHPMNEVAAQFGRAPATISQALLRIRRKLYRCIEAAQREEGR